MYRYADAENVLEDEKYMDRLKEGEQEEGHRNDDMEKDRNEESEEKPNDETEIWERNEKGISLKDIKKELESRYGPN
jgi:hypothetical protein